MRPLRASSYSRKLRSGKTSSGIQIPRQPPTGGWNTRDNIAELGPLDSPQMDNWFPGFGSVLLRNGFASYATGLGGVVEFMSEFNAGAFRKLLAAANGNVWDVSSAGAAVSLGSGFASNRWNSVQFDDFAGGARMGLVCKGNAPQIYNGVALSAMTLTGSGLTASNMGGIHSYKGRTYFWDPATQDFWYSAVGALGGAVAKFPLGRVQGTGGNLVAMGTWSRDGGLGPQDYAVFLLSSGDVIVYAGSNPGDPTDWQLVGVYSIGVPISQRGVKKIGSDLLALTKSGYIPIGSLIAQSRYAEQAGAISSKIRGAAVLAANAQGGTFGWDILHYPKSSMLIINVPVSSSEFQQHVMNTETGAWCRFKGLNAYAWSLLNEAPFFGGNGVVYQFDSGQSDNGAPIDGFVQTAWDYYGRKGSSKRLTAIRPILRTTGDSVPIQVAISSDFSDFRRVGTLKTPNSATGSFWDDPDWDSADWASDSAYTKKWIGANSTGFAIGTSLTSSSSNNSMEWLSTHYMFEDGGRL